MKGKNIFLTFIVIISFLLMPAIAANLDTSVNEEIRKNYNPSKLEDDMNLPEIPKFLQEESSVPQNTLTQQTDVEKQTEEIKQAVKTEIKPIKNMNKPANQVSAVLKKGTKVKLRLINNVSDKTRKGTKLTFVSLYPVTTTYFTIPTGTVFKGEVVNSHPPQFGANGGLIVIKLTSIVLNDGVVPINAYVTKADSKHIFFNNIKGKRKYLKSMASSTKNGRHFFKKMMGVTKNLATDGSSIVVAPFSVAAGCVGLGGNVLVSPVLALFHKGGPVAIKKDSDFEIKLIQDVMIYN